MNNAIRLSPAQIPTAAKNVARRSGLIAIPVLLFAGVVLLVFVLNIFASDSPKSVGYNMGHYFYLPLVGITVGGFGLQQLVQQHRATLAAVKASVDPTTFWYLDGFVVIPYVRGIPDARLSFKVPPKLRMHLASAGRYVPPP